MDAIMSAWYAGMACPTLSQVLSSHSRQKVMIETSHSWWGKMLQFHNCNIIIYLLPNVPPPLCLVLAPRSVSGYYSPSCVHIHGCSLPGETPWSSSDIRLQTSLKLVYSEVMFLCVCVCVVQALTLMVLNWRMLDSFLLIHYDSTCRKWAWSMGWVSLATPVKIFHS